MERFVWLICVLGRRGMEPGEVGGPRTWFVAHEFPQAHPTPFVGMLRFIRSDAYPTTELMFYDR